MRLFIKVSNGSAVDHPISEDNFRSAYPNIDLNILPDGFSEFVRAPQPIVQVYQVYTGVTYEQDGSVFKDVHHVRDMTDPEIAAKQQAVKDAWAADGLPSWQFNSESCVFDPPVAYPDDGNDYHWDETTVSWMPGLLPKEYNTGGS